MISTLGRVGRMPMRLIPADTPMPIIAPSTLRGMRWVAGAGLIGSWLGTFEMDKRRKFARYVRPGATVFDVGAQAGYYTLLASRLVGAQGSVVSFEPLPRNLANLRHHLDLNRIRNARVVPAAAGASPGRAGFLTESTSYMGRLDGAGDLTVDVVTLDDTAAEGSRPALLKIDVEGGEVDVLTGAARVLDEDRPVIFLATHGPDVHRDSCDLLRSVGYRLSPLDSDHLTTATEVLAVHVDHEGVRS